MDGTFECGRKGEMMRRSVEGGRGGENILGLVLALQRDRLITFRSGNCMADADNRRPGSVAEYGVVTSCVDTLSLNKGPASPA